MNDVKVVEFGREEVDDDTLNAIKNIILFYPTNVTMIMVESMKSIHCDPDYPQNHNIKISSLSGRYGTYFNGTYFRCTVKHDFFDKLRDFVFQRIIECISIFKDELPKYIGKIIHEEYKEFIRDSEKNKNLVKEFNAANYEFWKYLQKVKEEETYKKLFGEDWQWKMEEKKMRFK